MTKKKKADRRQAATAGVAIILVLAMGTGAAAQVALRFAPADTTIDVATAGHLSIVLDEAITVRTLDVSVAYDSTLVRTTGWSAGAIFTDPGFFLFKGFEETTPGHWHGYVIIMGAEDYATGPGELFVWEFTGLADGVTSIEVVPFEPDTVGVFLSNMDGDWYGDVTLSGTTVTVGDGFGSVPSVSNHPVIRLWPNPFNPSTVLEADLRVAGPAKVSVYDLTGRCVRSLASGYLPAGPAAWTWNGRDDLDRTVASGMYIFRFQSCSGSASARGILLK